MLVRVRIFCGKVRVKHEHYCHPFCPFQQSNRKMYDWKNVQGGLFQRDMAKEKRINVSDKEIDVNC